MEAPRVSSKNSSCLLRGGGGVVLVEAGQDGLGIGRGGLGDVRELGGQQGGVDGQVGGAVALAAGDDVGGAGGGGDNGALAVELQGEALQAGGHLALGAELGRGQHTRGDDVVQDQGVEALLDGGGQGVGVKGGERGLDAHAKALKQGGNGICGAI